MTEPARQEAQHPQQPPPIDAAALIGIYIELRDAKRKLEKQFEEALKPYTERMEAIELRLQKYMQETKLNSLPTDSGTAYISVKRNASVADAVAFRGHIIENRAWDLADWRANVNAIETFIKENDGTIPPGVNWREYETVGVRRPTK